MGCKVNSFLQTVQIFPNNLLLKPQKIVRNITSGAFLMDKMSVRRGREIRT